MDVGPGFSRLNTLLAQCFQGKRSIMQEILCLPYPWIQLSSHPLMMIAVSQISSSGRRGTHRSCSTLEIMRKTPTCYRSQRTHHSQSLCLIQSDPLRHENSAEEACDEEPVAKQSQKTSIPRSAEIAKLKAEQRLGESDSPS